MKLAELIMAVIMAAVSIGLMWKSAELPIGWLPRQGPGGGAFPFWLSAGMLVCCVWIIIRWFRGYFVSHGDAPYMDRETLMVFLTGAVSLTAMVASIYLIGVYGAIPLLLIFYMRFIGRHAWPLTALLATAFPVVTFLFFEITLTITLPKGLTEPLFYPLYDFFY